MNVVVTPSLFNVAIGPLPNLLVSGTGIVDLGPYLTTGYADTRYYPKTNPSGYTANTGQIVTYAFPYGPSIPVLTGGELRLTNSVTSFDLTRSLVLDDTPSAPGDYDIYLNNTLGNIHIRTDFVSDAIFISSGGAGYIGLYQSNPVYNLDVNGTIGNSAGGLASCYIDIGNAQIFDSNSGISIAWNDRILYDAGGVEMINWAAGGLRTAFNSSLDWFDRIVYDSNEVIVLNWQDKQLLDDTVPTGKLSVDWNTRILHDSSQNSSIEWNSRLMYNTYGNVGMSWAFGYLNDVNGHLSVNYGTRYLTHLNGNTTVDWGSHELIDSGFNASVDWLNRQLYQSNGSTVTADWENKILYDANGQRTISWGAYQLYDSSDNFVFSWSSQQMYAAIDNNLSIDWNNRTLFDTAGRLSTDWTNRTLKDNGTVGDDATSHNSIDWQNRRLVGLLLDDPGTTEFTTVDWQNLQLFDIAGDLTVDWSNCTLTENLANNISLNWKNRYLLASQYIDFTWTAVQSLNWQDRLAYDSSSNQSLNWDGRLLSGSWTVTDLTATNSIHTQAYSSSIVRTTGTSSYTVGSTDYTIIVSGQKNILLPPVSTTSGRILTIKQIANNSGVIVPSGTQKIENTGTYVLNQNNSAMIQSDGTNWWVLSKV